MKELQSSISDTPLDLSTNDFGTEKYVEGLAQFINNSATPITIALKGEWGSGKTSLMNRLYNDLCSSENSRFIGIKINTWEYSMLATPEETVLKIIVHLVNSLSGDDPKTAEKLVNLTKNAVNFVWRGLREWGKGVVPMAGVAVEASNVPNEIFSAARNAQNITLSDLKESLTQAISKSLGDSKRGVIIFVDDLDRLNPPLAVQILELLKNIFTLDKCIFILAIDYDVVIKGLEPKFGSYKPENDREFRSFFDKIIQVPFSLPVSNYRPLDFILDSLVSVGYISNVERNLPVIRNSIDKIVEVSVGKNPRSIKRLINTLSLLDCISKCSDDSITESIENKIMNFAIVALQVCYPKIYDMLTVNPVFDKWDSNIASKLDIHLPQNDNDSIREINGDIILDELGKKEIFYDKHHDDILDLNRIISENAAQINKEDPGEAIRGLLYRSSVTNVSASEPVKFDKKDLIYKLHDNVWSYITSQVPEMQSQFKRNTGNGGYFIYLKDNSYFEVIFQPHEGIGKIALNIFLDVWNRRPERLKDKSYDEVISDPKVINIISPMNNTVKRLITRYGLIEPHTLYGDKSFDDVFEEYKYRHEEFGEAITGTLNYWVNVKSATDFEDPLIVRAIGDLIISAYTMNNLALDID